KVVPNPAGAGDTASLVAVITNIGQAPTEANVVIGTKFRVDGKTLCWNDTLRGPLAPGQTVEVRPTGGFNSQTSLRLTPTRQTIVALVDDANRIAESDEKNNTETIVTAPSSLPRARTSDQPNR
ncbi:MAG TPA: CARDB domain-containing protein, partial [Rariglobus sp.]